jgi:hypothetical protein
MRNSILNIHGGTKSKGGHGPQKTSVRSLLACRLHFFFLERSHFIPTFLALARTRSSILN